MTETHYTTLGVSPNATAAEIKKKYRSLAFELHPDRHPDNKVAEERMKLVTAAYDVIGDETKRKIYDQKLQEQKNANFTYGQPKNNSSGFGSTGWRPHRNYRDERNFEDFDFSDLWNEFNFGDMFNSRVFQQMFGVGGDIIDHIIDVNISWAQSKRKMMHPIAYHRTEFCQTCPPPVTRNCNCHGYAGGRKTFVASLHSAIFPAGVVDGQLMTIDRGVVEYPAKIYHNLYIRIVITDQPGSQDSGDIEITARIPLEIAYHGGPLNVSSPTGLSIKAQIPARTYTGKLLRIQGMGNNTIIGVGDLYLVCQVIVPDSPTFTQQLMIRELLTLQQKNA